MIFKNPSPSVRDKSNVIGHCKNCDDFEFLCLEVTQLLYNLSCKSVFDTLLEYFMLYLCNQPSVNLSGKLRTEVRLELAMFTFYVHCSTTWAMTRLNKVETYHAALVLSLTPVRKKLWEFVCVGFIETSWTVYCWSRNWSPWDYDTKVPK